MKMSRNRTTKPTFISLNNVSREGRYDGFLLENEVTVNVCQPELIPPS